MKHYIAEILLKFGAKHQSISTNVIINRYIIVIFSGILNGITIEGR